MKNNLLPKSEKTMIKAGVSDTVTQYIMIAQQASLYNLNSIVSLLRSGLGPCFARVGKYPSVIHAEVFRPRPILFLDAMPPQTKKNGAKRAASATDASGADCVSVASGTTGRSPATNTKKKPRKAEVAENVVAGNIQSSPELPTWAHFRRLALAQSHQRLCSWGKHKLDEDLIVLTTFFSPGR